MNKNTLLRVAVLSVAAVLSSALRSSAIPASPEQFYFTDASDGVIGQFNFSTLTESTVATDPSSIAAWGLAAKPGGGLYVQDGYGPLMTLNGSTFTTNQNLGFSAWNVAVSPVNQDVYVSYLYSPTITQITPGGTVTTDWATNTSASAFSGLTFDSSGNLYAAEATTGDVIKFGSTGGTGSVFATGLSNPQQLVFGTDGNLYVANEAAGDIIKINGTSGGTGSVYYSGTLTFAPQDLAVDASGNLIVGNNNPMGSTNNITEIYALDSGGRVLISGLGTPEGIVVTPEPTTLALACMGLTGLLAMRRRQA